MVPFPVATSASHEWLEPMCSEPAIGETFQETRHGVSDILGLRNEEIFRAVVRPIFAWPQRFMVLRQACASGAILTERAASALLSSSGD